MTGDTYFNGNVYQNEGAGFYWNLAANSITNYSSRVILAGYNAMIWDNPTASDIRFRWGSTNIQRHTFSSNGALAIAGNFSGVNGNFTGPITSPTITTINTNISTINSNISNVNNTSDLNKPISTAQQTALDLKLNKTGDSLNAINGTFSGIITGPTITSINNTISAINNNISNINNTSDLNKPVSTAQQNALNLKANVNNTVLTGTSIIPTSSLGTVNCNNQIYFHSGNINTPSTPASRIHIASNELMVWDNVQTKFIFWRWGASNDNKQAFYDNGDVSIRGQILDCPTITTISNNINAKADITYTDNQLALKANLNNPIFTGTLTASNTNSTSYYTPQSAGGYYFHTPSNGISNPSSRISFSGGNVMFWDNYTPTNIQFRFGASPITKQTFFNNGDVSITGNILNCPTITAINDNLALKDDITSVNSKLSNYALLNSSPTFTGTIKGKVYSGDLSRSASNIVFTASTLPSTILQDTGISDTTIGIPNMPIGTRFTVMKTSPTVILYSTDSNVFFYSRRTSPVWQNNLTMREDSRTFIRAEIINPSNLAMIQVWMTESSHTYNLYETINTSIIGAFMLDGPNNGRTATANYRPITCSNKIFGPGNSDDGYIVNEGFSLIVYDGENYTGTFYTLSNYMAKETPGPFHFPSPMINNMQSCKLYYNLVEVVISGISN